MLDHLVLTGVTALKATHGELIFGNTYSVCFSSPPPPPPHSLNYYQFSGQGTSTVTATLMVLLLL
jgi:hypothetical protein